MLVSDILNYFPKEISNILSEYLKILSNDSVYYHYAVIKKISKSKINIWNPDPLSKKQQLSYDEFFKYWTGYAIFLEPDTGFKKSEKKEKLLFKFIPVFMSHKKLLAFSFI